MTTYADRLVDITFRLPGWAIAVGCSVLAAMLGWAFVNRPLLALLPALLVLALPLVLSARARFIVVVFGALTVFQSSDQLTAPKLLYLFALATSFGAALVRLPQLARSPAYHDLRPMLRAAVVLFGLILASLPVSVLYDVPQKMWLRDVAPYIMVACAPVFALDAQASWSARALRRLLVAGGVLGALGFMIRWLTSRQIADLSFVPVGLPTMLLASTVFAYGVAAILHGDRRRLAWAVLTSLVLAMLLSTGTRSVLILLTVPLVIALGSHHRLTQRSARLVVATPCVVLLVLLGAQAVVRVTNADRDILAARTSLLFASGDRSSDQSYIERLAQTSASWEAFRSHPFLGTGPGQPIVWTNFANEVQLSTVVDTPVSFLTKFGLIGLIAVAFMALGYVSTLRAFRARTGTPTIVQLTLIGFGAVVLGSALFQNPYEDKGLAIGLMLLLAVAAREASDAARGTQSDSMSPDARA